MNGSAQQQFMQAVTLHQQGKLEEAKDIYESILKTQPNHADALHLLGVIANQIGQPEQALHLISKAIAIQPNNAGFYINGGNALQALNRLDEAVAYFDKAIRLQPTIPDVHFNRANALHALNKYELALEGFERSLQLKPDYAEAYNNRGRVLQALGRLDEALSSYESAIQVRPQLAEAHHNHGLVLIKLGRQVEAISSFQLAMQARSSYLEPYVELSTSLHSLGKCEEALSVLERLLQFKNDDANLWNRRGNYLTQLQRYEEALDSYDRALQIDSNYYESYLNAGNVFSNKKMYRESIDLYNKSLAINSQYADAYYNRGIAYHVLLDLDSAIQSYSKAIDFSPNKAAYYYGRANSWLLLKRFKEAIKDFESAFSIQPEYELLLGLLVHTKQKINDWRSFSEDSGQLINRIDQGFNCLPCFAALAIFDSLEIHGKAAKLLMSRGFPGNNVLGKLQKRSKSQKIKIGYYSADFRDHPVSFLMAGVFEEHRRDQFEVFAFSSGYNCEGIYRNRVKSVVDHFIDINLLSDEDVAKVSRQYEIDIAIDLGGHTQDSRFGVFAYRAAPIQLSYIGYLGTMGAEYYDYILADHVLIPEASRSYYAEKVVYLPSYQANDSRRKMADRVFSRQELGLPSDGFVFCCFNNSYKISPSTFDLWMNILREVSSSVLMLYVAHPIARDNLSKEARQRGINPERIIFAERLPYDLHLTRCCAMDLFLDTLPYNAGATASDALWTGLPVLTLMGKSFASRYAASLLNAIDLPELITETPKAYEALAIELATHPEKLKTIKEKLKRNQLTTRLFDTHKFTLSLESAYQAMYDRYQADLPPDHLVIEA